MGAALLFDYSHLPGPQVALLPWLSREQAVKFADNTLLRRWRFELLDAWVRGAANWLDVVDLIEEIEAELDWRMEGYE